MGKIDDLKALYDAYLVDEHFQHLRDARRNFVPGKGPLKPLVMLVGEAPGRMENAKGLPFVGTAGTNLTNLMEDVNIDEYNVFQTNVVKYLPLKQEDGTYTPTEEEIAASREYIYKEVDIVEPLVVGMCGRTAIHAMFPEITDVFSKHGELLRGKFVPLYHPAMLSYQPWRKKQVRTGYMKLKAYADALKVA